MKCCSGVCGKDKRCTAVDGFPYALADGNAIDWDKLDDEFDDDEFEDNHPENAVSDHPEGGVSDHPEDGGSGHPEDSVSLGTDARGTGGDGGTEAVIGAAAGVCAVLAVVVATVMRSRRKRAAAAPAAPPSPLPSDSSTIWIGNVPSDDEDESENVFVVNANGTMRVASVRRHSDNPAWRRSSAGRVSLGPEVCNAEGAQNTGAIYVIDCDGPAFRRATSVSSAGSETARRLTDVSVVLEPASIDEEQDA